MKAFKELDFDFKFELVNVKKKCKYLKSDLIINIFL